MISATRWTGNKLFFKGGLTLEDRTLYSNVCVLLSGVEGEETDGGHVTDHSVDLVDSRPAGGMYLCHILVQYSHLGTGRSLREGAGYKMRKSQVQNFSRPPLLKSGNFLRPPSMWLKLQATM